MFKNRFAFFQPDAPGGGGEKPEDKEKKDEQELKVLRGSVDKNLSDLKPSGMIKDEAKITKLADALVEKKSMDELARLARRLYVCVEAYMTIGPNFNTLISPQARSQLLKQVNDVANNPTFLTGNLGTEDPNEAVVSTITHNIRDIRDIHNILNGCPPSSKAEADKIKKQVYDDPSTAPSAKIQAQKLEEQFRTDTADRYLADAMDGYDSAPGGKGPEDKEKKDEQELKVMRGAIDKNLSDLKPSGIIKDEEKITKLADELVDKKSPVELTRLARRLYVCVEAYMAIGPNYNTLISPQARSQLLKQVNDVANNPTFLTGNLGSEDPNEAVVSAITHNIRDIRDIHNILKGCPPSSKAEADKIIKQVYDDPSTASSAKIQAQKLRERLGFV